MAKDRGGGGRKPRIRAQGRGGTSAWLHTPKGKRPKRLHVPKIKRSKPLHAPKIKRHKFRAKDKAKEKAA